MAGKGHYHILTGGFIMVLLSSVLFSCKNDMEAIRMLDVVDTLPVMKASEIEILYSENGKVQVKLIGRTLISHQDDEQLLEFPDGFKVFFYDSNMNIKSTISADYGLSREKEKIMEARHNVVVENLEKNERLNTEELFWDQTKRKIYTEKFVRITRNDEVITGDGLTSDQSFEEIEILNPKGDIEIEDNDGPGRP